MSKTTKKGILVLAREEEEDQENEQNEEEETQPKKNSSKSKIKKSSIELTTITKKSKKPKKRVDDEEEEEPSQMSATMQAERAQRFSQFMSFNLIYFIGLFFTTFASNSTHTYFKFGPHAQLDVAWMIVDNWTIYSILLVIIVINNLTRVYRGEVIYPWLMTNLFNHQQPIIYGLGYYQTGYIALSYEMCELIYEIITILIVIAQLDLAIVTIGVSFLAQIAAVRSYLNEKSYDVYMRKYEILEDY